jgi:2-hydroxycyclohexanecarboxyl-CoA dehydrogenase
VSAHDRRVAVLTGGGSGMTLETARVLADQMVVAIWDVNGEAAEAAAASIRDDGGEALAWHVDVADSTSVSSAARGVHDRFGRVDVLVTGAGFVQFVDFLDLSEEHWDRMIDVHLKGTFLCTQAVVPFMRDREYGRIVCISSVGGMSGAARHSHYGAAKAGIIGFAKALCKEIGPDGITINVVAPGAIETPLWADAPQEAIARLAQTPVGRIGHSLDIAYAVRFLASEEAGFITGWTLSVNGGAYV